MDAPALVDVVLATPVGDIEGVYADEQEAIATARRLASESRRICVYAWPTDGTPPRVRPRIFGEFAKHDFTYR